MGVIKKAEELTFNSKIKCLIYGQSGIGKSTLAVSAPKPLLFDFDNGVHRVNFHHLKGVDTVQISCYQDILDVLNNEDLSPYETFVIDTGGKLLDYMAQHIILSNPRLSRSNGMLTLQGYTERKGMFSSLVKKISIMDKHIVFVAHRETKQEGDDIRYVPLFGGSNYDSLVTELDLVGYMEANGRERTITFDPTSRNDGKNTCGLPSVVKIPVILDSEGNPKGNNDYIQKHVIAKYYQRLEAHKAASKEYSALMEDLENEILLITDAQSANDFIQRVSKFKHIGNSKMASSILLKKHAEKLGILFDKDKGHYVKA